jgi:hypothetical protein
MAEIHHNKEAQDAEVNCKFRVRSPLWACEPPHKLNFQVNRMPLLVSTVGRKSYSNLEPSRFSIKRSSNTEILVS